MQSELVFELKRFELGFELKRVKDVKSSRSNLARRGEGAAQL